MTKAWCFTKKVAVLGLLLSSITLMSTSVPSSFYEGGEVLLGSEAGF